MQYKSAESKNIQKVNSVEDCIKIVILKIVVVARLAREDLLGPICQRCMKQKLHLSPPPPSMKSLKKLVGVVIIIKPVQNWHLEQSQWNRIDYNHIWHFIF